MAAAKFGPSTRGDTISLTYAAAIMAPAAMPKGTSSAAAMPINARPIVPAAPHEPTIMPIISVARKHTGKNSWGVTTSRP